MFTTKSIRKEIVFNRKMISKSPTVTLKFLVSPSWIVMTCNGCSIVLCQNKGQSEHLKMAAPNKFESQWTIVKWFFSIKNTIFSTNFSCNHYFLWLKVIFMQKWRFYVLNTNSNFYWTTKHASNYQREPMARREAGQTQLKLL